MPNPRPKLSVLFAVVILDLIGFGIVMPVLPFYAVEFGASPAVLGLLLAVWPAAQFVCAPLWGRLSDRIGRRPVLLGTVAGTAVSLLLLGLASSLAGLFAARLLAGAFAANISVAQAYIADVTAEEERTRWMGMIGASFGVGFVLGPALGGLLSPLGYHVPMLVAAGLSALNLVQAFFTLREPPRHAAPAPDADTGRLAALSEPLVRRLCAANFAFSLGVTQLESMFALFMLDRFGYDAREVAWILVAMAVVMGSIQGGGMKALSVRYADRTLIGTGCLLLAAAFFALPASAGLPFLLAVLFVAAVGRAVVQPPLMSMASVSAAVGSRGSVMGTFQASASLARVFGPAAAGLLYQWQVGAPFWVAAALVLTVAGLSRRLPASLPPAELAPAR